MKSNAVRYLYGSTTLSFAIRIGGVGLLFLANVLLAQALSMANYGKYAYVIELAAFGALITSLGFDQIAVRVVPDLTIDRDRSRLAAFLGAGTTITALIALILGVSLFVAHRFGVLLDDLSDRQVALAGGLLASLGLLRFGQEVMRGDKRIVLSQVVEQMAWPIVLLVLAIAMLAGLLVASVPMILTVQIGLYVLAGILLLALFVRRIPPALAGSGDEPAGERKAIGSWLAAGVPLALSGVMSLFLNRGDILALGTVGASETVASYSAASRFGALMVLGLAAASATTSALMREYWRQCEPAMLQSCVDRATGVATVFAVPLVVVFVVAPEAVLSIFGPGYTAAAPVLRILALTQLVNAVSGPVASIVIACDLEREYALAMASAAALMLGTLAILVPRYGALGAATSTAISLVSLNVALAVIVYRRTGIMSWVRLSGLMLTFRDLRAAARTAERALTRGRGDA